MGGAVGLRVADVVRQRRSRRSTGPLRGRRRPGVDFEVDAPVLDLTPSVCELGSYTRRRGRRPRLLGFAGCGSARPGPASGAGTALLPWCRALAGDLGPRAGGLARTSPRHGDRARPRPRSESRRILSRSETGRLLGRGPSRVHLSRGGVGGTIASRRHAAPRIPLASVYGSLLVTALTHGPRPGSSRA